MCTRRSDVRVYTQVPSRHDARYVYRERVCVSVKRPCLWYMVYGHNAYTPCVVRCRVGHSRQKKKKEKTTRTHR